MMINQVSGITSWALEKMISPTKNLPFITTFALGYFCFLTYCFHRVYSDPKYIDNKFSEGRVVHLYKFNCTKRPMREMTCKQHVLFQSPEGDLYKNIRPSSLSTKAFWLIPKIAVYSTALIAGNVFISVYRSFEAIKNSSISLYGIAKQARRVVKPAYYGFAMLAASFVTILKPLTGRVYFKTLEKYWHEEANHTNFLKLDPFRLLRGHQVWYVASDMMPIANINQKYQVAVIENWVKRFIRFNTWKNTNVND